MALIESGFIKQNDNPFEFDLDLNDVLALTPNNVSRIKFLLDNDSRYRPITNKEYRSVEQFFQEEKDTDWTEDPILLKELVRSIDITNRTHQNSKGSGITGNDGWELTANYISTIENLLPKLKQSDPELVDKIACALKQKDGLGKPIANKYSFSFASKFCTYVQRALFPDEAFANGYSIYDQVISKILPYYVSIYLEGKEEINPPYNGQKHYDPYSKFRDGRYAEEKDYKYDRFSDLIGSIIAANEKKIGYRITRENFDNLLWYYFKGEDSRRIAALQRIKSENIDSSRNKFKNSPTIKLDKPTIKVEINQ